MARIPAGVQELIDLSKIGGFSLPTELVESFNACLVIQKLDLEPLNVLDVDSGADEIRAIAMRAEPVDLLAIGRDIQAGNNDRAAVQSAQMAKQTALDRAADSLYGLTANLTETIITEHLRPAFETVLEAAKKPAETVRKHPGVTEKDLRLSESESARSVRAALRALEPLAERRSAIASARVQALRIGNRTPEHDHGNEFAELKTPQALTPGWKAPARFPRPNVPADVIERLIWLVTDGAPGQPWLPLPSEQDQVWMGIFGEVLAQQKANAAGWPRIMTN